jgi:hypothetical protein
MSEPAHIAQLRRGVHRRAGESQLPTTSAAQLRIATISAWAVGSQSRIVRLRPRAMTVEFKTMTAPMGTSRLRRPPQPLRGPFTSTPSRRRAGINGEDSSIDANAEYSHGAGTVDGLFWGGQV